MPVAYSTDEHQKWKHDVIALGLPDLSILCLLSSILFLTAALLKLKKHGGDQAVKLLDGKGVSE